MKIWLFYLYDKDDSRRLNPILYGLTDKKKQAEEFRNFRNMNLIVEREKEVSKKELMCLFSEFSFAVLTYVECTTHTPDSFITPTKLTLLCTSSEAMSILVKAEDVLPKKFKDCMIDVSMFDDDIIQSLYKLGYFYIYQWLLYNGYIYQELDPYFDGIKDNPEILTDVKIKYDEFSIFMYLYGNTVKSTRTE